MPQPVQMYQNLCEGYTGSGRRKSILNRMYACHNPRTETLLRLRNSFGKHYNIVEALENLREILQLQYSVLFYVLFGGAGGAGGGRGGAGGPGPGAGEGGK